MDNVTHGLVGLVTSGLLPHTMRPAPDTGERKALLWAGLSGSEVPDIDILYRLGGEMSYLNLHRGLTHSLGAIALFTLVLTLGIKRFYPEARVSRIGSVAGLSVGLHVFLDLLTSYGTMIFYPFNLTRFALDVLPIVDVYLVGLLVLATALLFTGLRNPRGATWVVVLITLYLSARAGSHWYSYQKVTASQPLGTYSQTGVFPDFLNPLRWQFVVKTPDKYIIGEVAVNGPVRATRELPIQPPNSLTRAMLQTPVARVFLDFARYPYVTCQQDSGYTTVLISDLRYQHHGYNYFVAYIRTDGKRQVISSGLNPSPVEDQVQ